MDRLAVARRKKTSSFFQHGVFVVAGFFQQFFSLAVDFDAGQYLFVADAAAWIGIDDIDQFPRWSICRRR